MKKILLLWFIFLFCCTTLSLASESDERAKASGQIEERCTKYLTALKYQDWNEAYIYISSKTKKDKFIEMMQQRWWNEVNNPFAPKLLGFEIEKIKFLNQFVDEAEVWITEKSKLWQAGAGWTEIRTPYAYYWVKEADGFWYYEVLKEKR